MGLALQCSAMNDTPSFVFATCQVGAEQALKHEVAREWPSLRFAFSRPGFLTFKIAPGKKLPDDFDAKLVFARAAGFCLGKASGETPAERATSVWNLIDGRQVHAVHVWPRDRSSPGFRDYEPGLTPEAAEIERVIRECASPLNKTLAPSSNLQFAICNLQSPSERNEVKRNHTAPKGPPCPPLRRGGEQAMVADIVVVAPDEWWVGYHHAHSVTSSWPGGFCETELPADAVSRAWLKMHEAVLWAGFVLKAGERCVEVGSAPGGASQFLLSRGLDVIGIDPAVIDPVVLADPHFRHIRKRAKEVPRKEFVGIDWLTSDVNLPPNYTLDAVGAIVKHPGVRLKGLLLTLKLVEWSLADDVPKFLERIRSWGFRNVRARQLHHNRQEICVAASGYRAPGEKPARAPKAKHRQSARGAQRSKAEKSGTEKWTKRREH
jgi:23S rRNA (cytidine2498-2'-O)-methyltransferase